MSTPPSYIPLSASTYSTPATSADQQFEQWEPRINRRSDRSSEQRSLYENIVEGPFDAKCFILWSLLSVGSWLIMGVMAYSASLGPLNGDAAGFLIALLMFTMIISTLVACGSAPRGWLGEASYTTMTTFVVWGLTVTYMLIAPGWANEYAVLFVVSGSVYAGILLEAFTGVSRRFVLLFGPPPQKQDTCSTAV